MYRKFIIPAFILTLTAAFGALGQTTTNLPSATDQQSNTQTQDTEEQKKAKEAAEKKAYVLLDEVVNQLGMLRLPENRIRIQVAAGDMLCARDPDRARTLFSQA